jgi:hypothetical protein
LVLAKELRLYLRLISAHLLQFLGTMVGQVAQGKGEEKGLGKEDMLPLAWVLTVLVPQLQDLDYVVEHVFLLEATPLLLLLQMVVLAALVDMCFAVLLPVLVQEDRALQGLHSKIE